MKKIYHIVEYFKIFLNFCQSVKLCFLLIVLISFNDVYGQTKGVTSIPITDFVKEKSQYYSFKSNEIVSDEILLKAGWNLISLDVIPKDAGIKKLFANLKQNNLELVIGFEEGNKIYDVENPDWLNTLNALKIGAGYWVKVKEDDLLIVYGEEILDGYRKALNPGWNLISYIPKESDALQMYLKDVIDNENLLVLTGYQVEERFFVVKEAEQENTLLSLHNGEGYWLKVNKIEEEKNPCIREQAFNLYFCGQMDTVLLVAPDGFTYDWGDGNSSQSITISDEGDYVVTLSKDSCKQDFIYRVDVFSNCFDPCNTIFGCTDENACNYDSAVNCDNGSCIFESACDADACTNGGIYTWDTTNCECALVTVTVVGCTDPSACNYDAAANCNDASCIFESACDADACTNGGIYTWDSNCTCSLTIATVFGCTDPSACNYDSAANCNDGSCILESACDADVCTNGGIYTWDFATCECALVTVTVVGCTDPTATNYDLIANCNDGCIYNNPGCLDPCAPNYDSTADMDDGSCEGYDMTCNTDCTLGDLSEWDADSCECVTVVIVFGCTTDENACNYDPMANCSSECDFTSCVGCTDPSACNYNPSATIDNGTCELPDGCTDNNACNYDAVANCDDGTCDYGCDDSCDSLALVALYNSTDGPNWINTWDLSQPVSEWYGITLDNGGCRVTEINLVENRLSGSIPSELGNLSSLESLDLSYNQLNGSIPSELSNLSSLKGLDLSYNQLSGSIPPDLGNLSNLVDLWLLFNELSGSIPSELGNLASLDFLNISNNQLSGCYPESLCDLNIDITSSSSGFNNNLNLPDEGSATGFLAFCNQDSEYYPCAYCQDINACNYDPNAMERDDSLCQYPNIDPCWDNMTWDANCECN